MPTYEYFCPENGQSVEVLHPMSTTLNTWGEICSTQDLDLGNTPANTPVEKLLGTGMVLTNARAARNDNCGGPSPSGGCCGGGCGMG
ncbi:MAG: hypothetical protein V3V20_10760 [Algisphaera sp.]